MCGISRAVVYIEQMKSALHAVAALVAFSGLLASREARAQFYLVSSPPGVLSERVFALSDDGTVAAGGRHATPASGFTWSVAGGLNNFGAMPGMPNQSWARGISGNGQVVVGAAASTLDVDERAYRYTGGSSLEILGVQAGYTRSYAQDASFNGDVVVGRSEIGGFGDAGQAFRWTSTTGLVGLGYLQPGQSYSEAAAVSRDGAVVVGHVRQTTGSNQAFVWREGTGMVGLPGLDATNDGQARGIDATGAVIVGHSRPGPFQRAATMWVNGIPVNLGVPTGFVRSTANAVNDNGSVVVGQLDGIGQTAAIWTPSRGMEPLSAYLSFHGITVPSGINLLTATAVSADGRTIAGYTGPPGAGIQGWVVTVPSPGSVLVLSALPLARSRRRN